MDDTILIKRKHKRKLSLDNNNFITFSYQDAFIHACEAGNVKAARYLFSKYPDIQKIVEIKKIIKSIYKNDYHDIFYFIIDTFPLFDLSLIHI